MASSSAGHPPCSIGVREFQGQYSDGVAALQVDFRVVALARTDFVYVGAAAGPVMADLSLATQTPYDPVPICSQLLGPRAPGHDQKAALGRRLALKRGRRVLLSYNLETSAPVMTWVEQQLRDLFEERF